ncbi:hypothetical protein DFH11DRAFT_1568334 [Phellopilus nigrolimitatus]|nr:hypothetical protein DFH11DRAFT_1568334 [Phellopilus nigrolimitatus]
MPRLLPRLLKSLENRPLAQSEYRGPLVELRRRRRRSLWKPLPNSADASFSFGRKQSILLDENNVLMSPGDYTRHKTLPPAVKLQKAHRGVAVDHDITREMSEEERQWWSSPYLRMLSTPIRRCSMSNRHIPSDFLIRLTVLKSPPSHGVAAETHIVPDGLLHPRFTNRMFGFGYYIVCWKDAVASMLDRGLYRKFAPNISAHSLFLTQIEHQLRLRVLQELDMLAARLLNEPRRSDNDVVLRRLTRSEWATVKDTGRIPWEGAAFVLIVPPVNRDVQTGQRPQPDSGNSNLPSVDVQLETPSGKELPPLPHYSAYDEQIEFLSDNHLPHSRVPLYNGLPLFPSRTQRAALHEKLCRVLDLEKRDSQKKRKYKKGLSREEDSHAFVVFSSAHTVVRADSVPLAIALWRIRMWEGEGWGSRSWRESSHLS